MTYHPERDKFFWNNFFLSGGIAGLFVWNSILSLSNYWTNKFDEKAINYMGSLYFVGSLLSIPLFGTINKLLKFRIQIVLFPI